MEPIRGPIDYNKYPPRTRNARRAAQTLRRPVAPRAVQSADEATRDEEQRDEMYSDETGGAFLSADEQAEHRPRSRRRVERHYRRQHVAPTFASESPLAPDEFAAADAFVDSPRAVGHAGRPGSRAAARRAPLWKRARRWSLLLLLILLAELGLAALTAPDFNIVGVSVQGIAVTPQRDVDGVQSVLVGQNWLRARLGQARRELEALPSVRQARLTRLLSWPPQVLITVEERQPFARVGAGDEWWVVDDSGIPFRRATAADAALYAVTGPVLQPVMGRALPPSAWRPVREFAAALSINERQGARWVLRRLYFDRHGFASLRLQGGAHDELLVQLGADRWPEKLQRARQALAYFEATGRRARTLNLLSYSMVTWTPRDAVHGPQNNAAPATPSDRESALPAAAAPVSATALEATNAPAPA